MYVCIRYDRYYRSQAAVLACWLLICICKASEENARRSSANQHRDRPSITSTVDAEASTQLFVGGWEGVNRNSGHELRRWTNRRAEQSPLENWHECLESDYPTSLATKYVVRPAWLKQYRVSHSV
ncbi:hypothetical protein SCLCIDRAFT_764453 [Scleroderma citrinum Foug A]|uniref:Secreted protein n=1 Tax=Scleroderma citrinum Foug A TaxID=1036808 RepID=A0A0C3DRM3_9AGAM|nr:hypothetical protein SCLCIDRAFT_764453 [Scleroderma citrinum Foug A]